MRVLILLSILMLFGCSDGKNESEALLSDLDRILVREPKVSTPGGWIKHDDKDCKFSFSQDVVITRGFYRGQTGAVIGLREDGYVIDIYGYRGMKPNGRLMHRSDVVYGVPESDLELDAKSFSPSVDRE